MLRDLILKEVREHLLAFRLQAGVGLMLVLLATSALVLASGWERDRDEIARAQRTEDDFARNYAHLNRISGALRAWTPPARMVLVRGLPAEGGLETLETDPVRELFAPLDLTTVVGVLLSLLAILLGFDAVNGEKERGTLRQVLANPVRRADLIFAKWVAGLLVIGATLVLGFLLAALVVGLRAPGVWTSTEYLAWAATACVSFLYGAVFYTIGLAASSLTRLPSVSVLMALLAWVALVLVVPNTSPYVAAQFVRLPAVAALQRDVQRITSEDRDALGEAESRPVLARYADVTAATSGVRGEELKRRLSADPALKVRFEAMRREVDAVWSDVNRRQREKAARLNQDHERKVELQLALSKTLASASPLASMTFALTELADTGFSGAERRARQAAEWSRALSNYLDLRYEAEKAKNPTLGVNDFLDVSDRPRFRYEPTPLGERLAHALPHAGALAVWCLLAFAVAVFGFQRFDVR